MSFAASHHVAPLCAPSHGPTLACTPTQATASSTKRHIIVEPQAIIAAPLGSLPYGDRFQFARQDKDEETFAHLPNFVLMNEAS
jgi:hypothetical protein